MGNEQRIASLEATVVSLATSLTSLSCEVADLQMTVSDLAGAVGAPALRLAVKDGSASMTIEGGRVSLSAERHTFED